MEEALQILNLTKNYGSVLAVDRLTFSVEAGQICGLLGPNGAGKSTTIKMLTTLLPPTFGTAKIKGYDILKEPVKVRAEIGYVPQSLSVDKELTAYENLLLSGRLYGLSSPLLQERMKTVLDFMNLSEYAHLLVADLSGGMIKRLEIAMALLHKPAVLFLDEPTAGLDLATRKSLWISIQEWGWHFGTTILISSHDIEEIDKICDFVAFLHLGKLIALNTPYNFKAEMGKDSKLEEVFLQLAEGPGKEGEDKHAKKTRQILSRLDSHT